MRDTAIAGTEDFPLQGLVQLALAGEGADDWQMHDDGFWCRVEPAGSSRRVQGWKLHVSATVLSAPEVLYRAASVLIRHGCEFKFAGRMSDVLGLTSNRYDRAQCGKFITAYPRDDDQFRVLADELDRATAGLPGPAILSDRPVRAGSLVHYRYGAFAGVSFLTNDGQWQVRLEGPDGEPVEDLRKPWFTPPPWAELPLPGLPGRNGHAEGRSVLLNGRYVVHEAIQHSARGGVFRATDRSTGGDVVIKQARANVGAMPDGQDARVALRREAAALTDLAGLGADLVELFEQGDHVFLVESVVPGTVLSGWVYRRLVESAGDGVLAPDEAVALAVRLTDLLAEVHRRGLVFRDFTPNNLMVTPEGTLWLIDPELAVTAGRWTYRSHTPGYGAPEYLSGASYGPAPEQSSDLFSLGAVLFYLTTGVNAAFARDEPQARPPEERLRVVLGLSAGDNAAARTLAPAILGLCASDPPQRWSIERLREFLADPTAESADPIAEAAGPAVGPVRRGGLSLAEQHRLVDDGLAHVLATMGADDTTRLWPSGPFGQNTDPCNVQHGVAGVLAALTRASEVLGRDDLRAAVGRCVNWLDGRLDGGSRILPGLHFGRAGAAWAMFDAARHLGDEARAERALDLALTLPTRWPNPDLFHGVAGSGLTQLRLWQGTGRPEFLQRANDCADALLDARLVTDDGVVWPVSEDFDSALAGIRHLGFAHGVAGVATFLLAVARATGREDCRAAAVAAGATLAATAEHGPWGARWRTDQRDEPGTGMLYHLCSGSSGIGTFLLRLWRDTGDPTARTLAEQAALAVYRTRWAAGSAYCHGLAGNGEFLLDMADALDGPYRDWAEDLVGCLYAGHAVHNGRLVLPDESATRVTVDYGVGLTGALAFLLRLRHGGPRMWLLDDLHGSGAAPSAGSTTATVPGRDRMAGVSR